MLLFSSKPCSILKPIHSWYSKSLQYFQFLKEIGKFSLIKILRIATTMIECQLKAENQQFQISHLITKRGGKKTIIIEDKHKILVYNLKFKPNSSNN